MRKVVEGPTLYVGGGDMLNRGSAIRNKGGRARVHYLICPVVKESDATGDFRSDVRPLCDFKQVLQFFFAIFRGPLPPPLERFRPSASVVDSVIA